MAPAAAAAAYRAGPGESRPRPICVCLILGPSTKVPDRSLNAACCSPQTDRAQREMQAYVAAAPGQQRKSVREALTRRVADAETAGRTLRERQKVSLQSFVLHFPKLVVFRSPLHGCGRNRRVSRTRPWGACGLPMRGATWSGCWSARPAVQQRSVVGQEQGQGATGWCCEVNLCPKSMRMA